MKNHAEKEHTESNFIYTCGLCALWTYFIGEMWKHKLEKHCDEKYTFAPDEIKVKDDVLHFNLLAEQNTEMMNS